MKARTQREAVNDGTLFGCCLRPSGGVCVEHPECETVDELMGHVATTRPDWRGKTVFVYRVDKVQRNGTKHIVPLADQTVPKE